MQVNFSHDVEDTDILWQRKEVGYLTRDDYIIGNVPFEASFVLDLNGFQAVNFSTWKFPVPQLEAKLVQPQLLELRVCNLVLKRILVELGETRQ